MVSHKKILLALSSTIVMGALVLLAIRIPNTAIAGTAQNVSGWGWSSNIGWVSFNSTNEGLSLGYGVNISPTTGTGSFSGYAWSPSIGWISFDPATLTPGTSGCTVAPCAPTFNWTTKVVTGWARACGVFSSGCSGALKLSSELGGWDGWISLAGVKLDGTHTYAWGADVVGLMDLSGVTVAAALTLATPAILPVGGTYNNDRSVTMTGPAGATIRYTTDGSIPGATSPIYSSALTVNRTGTTVKAKASRVGYTDSAVASQTYTLTAATPTISKTSGTYSPSVTTTIASATIGATIRYTTDGSIPVVTSPIYTSALTFTVDTTLTAKAFRTNYNESAAATATYIITAPQCNDGIDNEPDGKTDFDKDGDGVKDADADPGCTDANDTTESPDPTPTACNDNFDNDNDGLIDYDKDGDGVKDSDADPGCSSVIDNNEFNLKSIQPK